MAVKEVQPSQGKTGRRKEKKKKRRGRGYRSLLLQANTGKNAGALFQ